MPKQTTLDENAVIYQPRQELTEKEKLKDMSFGDRLSYLWEYYKVHAIITVAVIGLISYIIYNIVTPDIKSQFYAAMIDNTIDEQAIEEFKANFAEVLQLDPKTESIDLNTSFYLSTGDEYAMNMKSVLSTYVAAKDVDVIIAPQSVFESYAYYGYMAKMSDQLPTDIYATLTDNFYISDLEDDPEKNVYGIYLTETSLYKNNANNTDPYILGIVANSQHKDNTVEFIRTLFRE